MRDYDAITADAADRRPFSNSTQWEIFSASWCWRDCVKDRDEDCPLIMVALLGKTPTEWTVEDGTVTECSEFQEGSGEPAVADRRPDGEFVGQTDILRALSVAPTGGLPSTGSPSDVLPGTGTPPAVPDGLRETLETFRGLADGVDGLDPNQPVRLVCGEQFLKWMVALTEISTRAGEVEFTHVYGLPVELDMQADPRGWALLNAYGIRIRGGQLNA